MSNDRIWLRCSKCGEKRLLYKYYPSSNGYAWYDGDDGSKGIEQLGEFMETHLGECLKFPHDLSNGQPFLLQTEDETMAWERSK